jgi:hypothetical protein
MKPQKIACQDTRTGSGPVTAGIMGLPIPQVKGFV